MTPTFCTICEKLIGDTDEPPERGIMCPICVCVWLQLETELEAIEAVIEV